MAGFLSARTRAQVGFLLGVSVVCTGVTAAFGFARGFPPEMVATFHAPMGFLASLLVGGGEIFFLQPAMRGWRQAAQLLTRAVYYVGASVPLAMGLLRLSGFGAHIPPGKFATGIMFGVGLAFLGSLVATLNRILGPGVLPRLILGSYHRPFEQERLFMFVDMRSSTTLAESLGHLRFLDLLNDAFADMSPAVLESGGEIHKYVGDELILTWRMDRGLRAGRCVRCFLEMRERLRAREEHYRARYGVVPEFKAGLHGGWVVAGELGSDKVEIAFLGDVVNTTARIQGECGRLGRDFLVSGEVAERLGPLEGVRFESLGALALRGKAREVEILAVATP